MVTSLPECLGSYKGSDWLELLGLIMSLTVDETAGDLPVRDVGLRAGLITVLTGVYRADTVCVYLCCEIICIFISGLFK